MQRAERFEIFFYIVALATGCCISVLLKLNETNFNGDCLLFGKLDILTNNIFMGSQAYCNFTFYSSLTNAILAILLGFGQCCCSVHTYNWSVVYFKFMATILAAIAWINCLVCTIFIITGFNKWCNSVTNNGNIERCKNAERWDWTVYRPVGIDGRSFYTHLFIAEVASYSALGIWFIITVFSGRNFKKSLFEMKASEYYITDERMAYSSPIQEIPFYEVTSDRGSRYL